MLSELESYVISLKYQIDGNLLFICRENFTKKGLGKVFLFPDLFNIKDEQIIRSFEIF